MTVLVIAIIVTLWGGLCLYFAPQLYRCWREPVLRSPVFILESDDWGAGPLEQVGALEQLRSLLLRFQDGQGMQPVMTVGVILAVADTARIREQGCEAYNFIDLAHPDFSAIHEQLLKGNQEKVFALQLHGKEHYWPESVMSKAHSDQTVRAWLTESGIPLTEDLPSHLQARWTDASVLPSRAHPKERIEAAVRDEIRLYEACFSERPSVAVATTFVWNADVERAWAGQGIDTVITPGRRYTSRDAQGLPGGVDKVMSNGERSEAGQTYLVRDVYFEPSLGHAAPRLLGDAMRRAELGRPILVEIHRFNFMGGEQRIAASLQALEQGLAATMAALPEVRFMSSQELAGIYRAADPAFLESRWLPHAVIWLRRIEELQAFRRLAKMTGLIVILWMLKMGFSSLSPRERERG